MASVFRQLFCGDTVFVKFLFGIVVFRAPPPQMSSFHHWWMWPHLCFVEVRKGDTQDITTGTITYEPAPANAIIFSDLKNCRVTWIEGEVGILLTSNKKRLTTLQKKSF